MQTLAACPRPFATVASPVVALLPIVVVGVVGGVVAVAYVLLLRVLESFVGPGTHAVAVQAILLVGAGSIVAVGTRWLGPTGDVELVVDNIHVLGGSETMRETRAMLPISLACIAVGGALGPEAPMVQTTGTLGTWIAQRWHLDRDATRILTITGMAAGLAVLFGAPLGAALFALEILHRRGLQYYEAVLPAAIGAVAGWLVAALVLRSGLSPVWAFPPVGPIVATDLVWAVGAAVGAAAMALMFTALATHGRRAFDRLPPAARPIVGGALLAGLATLSPYALTFGEEQLTTVLLGRLTLGALALAVCAKLAGTLTSIVSGWKGGFIIPLFFLGATMGQVLHVLCPSANETVVMACFMVGLCVGVTKTPFGSALVVTEMAGMALLPTTLVAALVALVLTSRSGLIHGQRDRDAQPEQRPEPDSEPEPEREREHEPEHGDETPALRRSDP